MSSTEKRTIWLVIDHGGAWEDYWENVVCAFTKENAANEYAEKRKEERKGKRDRTMDDNGDYSTTTVNSVTLIESGER